jgi:hypothetical protein
MKIAGKILKIIFLARKNFQKKIFCLKIAKKKRNFVINYFFKKTFKSLWKRPKKLT